MRDLLPAFEKAAKGVYRFARAASDNLALLINGTCRETYTDATEASDPDYEREWVNRCCPHGCDCGDCYSRSPDQTDPHHCTDSAVPPAAADPAGSVLAEAPNTATATPAGSPTPPSRDKPGLPELLLDGANAIELWLSGRTVPEYQRETRSAWQLNAVYMRQLAEQLDPAVPEK